MAKRAYFSDLNYTLANEDSRLEYAMVQKLRPRRVLAVCGSGGRSLPLASYAQEALVCCDLSAPQLALARHREATLRQLKYQDFLLYWGFAPFSARENSFLRKRLFQNLDLQPADQDYFADLYEQNGSAGLIYEGRWERTFTGIAKMGRRIVGSRYDEIFSFYSLAEQRRYFDKALKDLKWLWFPRLVLFLVGNARFFNSFLYKGDFVRKNHELSSFAFYQRAFRRLFLQGLTRENFFLQICFLGEVRFPEGNPVEALSENFQKIRAGLSRCRIRYELCDVLEVAQRSEESPFDFVSLSDVPSYFQGELEVQYLQKLRRGLNKGALVVVRFYLRTPENTDFSGFEEVTEEYRDLIDAEKTQMYSIHVYRHLGEGVHS